MSSSLLEQTARASSRFIQRQETPARLIALPDGRRLAYAEYGDPSGQPLFYCHSQGSSRLEGGLFHQAARLHGFRVIAIDRPGIGFSDARPGMKHKHFAQDVLDLADALTLPQFAVLAWAGGAPFAFALAQASPGRVKLVISVAGLPAQQHLRPASSLGAGLSQLSQAAMRGLLGLRQLWCTRDPKQYLTDLQENVCFADRKILANARFNDRLLQALQESRRQGSSHVVRDTSRCFDSWDFDLAQISLPVHLWHGSADSVVPVHFSVRLTERLPQAILRVPRNRGHLFFVQEAGDILQQARAALQDQSGRDYKDLSEAGRGGVPSVKIPRHIGNTKTQFADGSRLATGFLHS